MNSPVWLITGASRGFGNSFARVALANGCRVVATARKPASIAASLGKFDDLLPVELDVTDAQSIKSAVARAVETFGRIDVLVNNAGFGIFGSLEETTDEEMRAIYETNVFGAMNVTRAVLPIMRAQKSGRIVNMGSMASFACDPGGTLYDSTKFAIAGMSEALALEMKPFGIESMVVEPGMFRTNFFDGSSIRTPSSPLKAYDGTPARSAEEYCLGHNYQQHGDPDKAAAFVYRIVADEETPLPLWLPVGKDAFKKFEKKLASMIDSVAAYREEGSNLFIDQS